MQYDRDMEYLRRYYDREKAKAVEMITSSKNSETGAQKVKVKKKPTNPVDKYVEKYNQLPQEKLKSILKSSTKLKNHGVVVRQCHGGEKIQNKMREIDRLLKECELEEQQRVADQIKRREEMKVRDLKYWEERRDRKISQYYLKLLGHGDRPVEELIQLTEEDEAKGAVRKKTHVDKPSDESSSDESDEDSVLSLNQLHAGNVSRLERDENGIVIGLKKEVSKEQLERRATKKAWKEARKTRYVRTREKRKMETELTLAEMFGNEELH